jgi:hypothetical protein
LRRTNPSASRVGELYISYSLTAIFVKHVARDSSCIPDGARVYLSYSCLIVGCHLIDSHCYLPPSNSILSYTFTNSLFLCSYSAPHTLQKTTYKFGSRCMVRRLLFFTLHSPFTSNEQLTDKLSSLTALLTALTDLDSLCETVENVYDISLRKDKYEKWEEKS